MTDRSSDDESEELSPIPSSGTYQGDTQQLEENSSDQNVTRSQTRKKSSLEEANQILQQLLSRQVQVPSPVQVVEDEIACLMHCYAVTMKTFPPLILARVKRDIGAIVSEAELQTISNSHNQIQVLDEIVLSSPANAIEDEKIQIDMHGSGATFGMVIHPTETDGEISDESFHYTFIEENHEQDFF